MYSTLVESLDVLLGTGIKSPSLEHLIGQDAALSLKALAGNLAPIFQGGFECRLSANATQVDLQQCIVCNEQELDLLQEFMEVAISTCEETAYPEWLRLRDFLAEWRSCLESIPEIWLEFDVDKNYGTPPPTPPRQRGGEITQGFGDQNLGNLLPISHSQGGGEIKQGFVSIQPDLISSFVLPLPAIFFGLPQEVSPSVETYGIAAQSLNLLLGDLGWSGWEDNLYRCFAACPDGAFVSHIGVMLSRNSPALRVNVKRLQPHFLIPYLQQIGWQGDTVKVAELMEELFALVDRITVCLDVGDQIYPQIGLECIFLNQPDSESRWAIFLDYLVERGLCEVQKREALLNWPGQINPLNSPAPWPHNLIAASVLQQRERFTVFERRLSHIKIVSQSQSPLVAKAYLWFQHQWLSGASKI
ncbi:MULTISPECIES: hypothetical protein [unclassified Nodularia (in: cyanobacteria)]|uniref:hypothetical protein n=1 Tax=unclassified Nodularia (in: cyanobacteria) TaxID=2656917 RepID=UPI00187E78E3|nr:MULTISPECIES: hypothetical protein [unclassified Nodularia (in: cyanobacteria)]MBE9198374.1 hypothetical protein [Nodularia sp. LEGE 06071]MCC2691161.1 hypothetical protein [Nodularia sp. LEGE 04288]